MAIEFKSAPKAVAPENAEQGGGAMDIVMMLQESGKLNMVMLIVLVVVIYGIVVYLRTTPGYRITDIPLKRRPGGDPAVTRQRRAVADEAREPVEQN